MVGNRQITQSVAKQLDIVSLSEIKPFGRVKLSDGMFVIGANNDGTLVLSSLRRREWMKVKVGRETEHNYQELTAAGWKISHQEGGYHMLSRLVDPDLLDKYINMPLIVLAGLR